MGFYCSCFRGNDRNVILLLDLMEHNVKLHHVDVRMLDEEQLIYWSQSATE